MTAWRSSWLRTSKASREGSAIQTDRFVVSAWSSRVRSSAGGPSAAGCRVWVSTSPDRGRGGVTLLKGQVWKGWRKRRIWLEALRWGRTWTVEGEESEADGAVRWEAARAWPDGAKAGAETVMEGGSVLKSSH